MKTKLFLTLIIFGAGSLISNAQNLSDAVKIHDTRDINNPPSFIKNTLRLDFKRRSIINVPGKGEYSTNVTFSPWYDATGNLNHQLNFNDGGLYYRNGSHASTSWNNWKRIALTETDGSLRIGDIGNAGNISVPIGAQTVQFNIDFTGYRDIAPDQVGARIAAYRINNWTNHQAFVQKTGLSFYTNSTGTYADSRDLKERLRITPEGKVGIGTSTPTELLEVAGTIRAREVKVEVNAGADHVFKPDYNLLKLEEVEAFVKENKHLPEIPSEKEMQEKGLSVNEFQIKLLQKIEELTLYTIEQNKRIQQLEDALLNK
jgi:hypothetical protein